MTKAELIEILHTATSLPKKDCAVMMESVLSIMKEALEAGEPIKVSGFGSFIINQKAERRGRNPQTGEPLTIASRKVLSFRPSTVLRDAINRGVV